MDRPHRGPAGPARAGGAPVSAIIEAQNVVKSFGQTPALRGASLGVRQGEIVAVMGPSGSGKSTLLHCLAGILVPDEGQVWFGGQRLDTLSDERRSALRRDRFGFVFQSGQLVPELTAEENVALPLLLSGTRRGPATTAARKWFGTLGLDGLEGRRSGELSGGQAQRGAAQSTPMRRVGSMAEVASAVLWLCSDQSSFITGTVLPIDGGQAAGNKPPQMYRQGQPMPASPPAG